MFFIFLLFLLVSRAAARLITIPSDRGVSSIQQRDESFVLLVNAVGSHTITVLPSNAALVATAGSSPLFVSFTSAESPGACFAVFIDSLVEENLLGCLGKTCLNTGDDYLSLCPSTSSSAQDIIGVIQSYDILHIVVGATSKSLSHTLLLDMRFKHTDPAANCPVYEGVIADSGHVRVSSSFSLSVPATIHMGTSHATMPASQLSISLPLPSSSIISRAVEDLRVYIVSESCISELVIPRALRHAASDLFEFVDFTLFMHPPTLKVVVGAPLITPSLPKVMVMASLYRDDGLVDSATMQGESVVLNLDHCRGEHAVVVQVMYLEGVTVLTKCKTFDPATFCLNQQLSYTCFCDAPVSRRLLLDMSEWTNVTVPPAQFILTVPVADPSFSIVSSDCGLMVTSSCMAIDLVTGRTYYSTEPSIDGVCDVSLPMGVYSFYHAMMPVADLQAGYFSTEYGFNYPLVVVCQVDTPSAEFYPDLNYVAAFSGITCPVLPREVSDNTTVWRSLQSVSSITWLLYNASYTDGCVENVCFNPGVGVYTALIMRSVDGSPYTLVTATASVDSNPQLLQPTYCDTVPLTLSTNYLPTFATDHGAFVTISLSGPIGPERWAMQVTQNGVVQGNWMMVPHFPMMYPMRSGVTYSFRAMMMVYASSDIILSDVCYVDVGVINAAPQAVIQVQSPIQVITCTLGTIILFDVYANIAITESPTAGIPVDFHDAPGRFVAGPVDLDNYVPGSLILTFKIGLHGQVIDKTVDAMILEKLYPAPVQFEVIDLTEMNGHPPASLFHCGLDEDSSMHQLKLTVSNPTWLPQVVEGDDGEGFVSDVDVAGSAYIITVPLKPLGDSSGSSSTLNTGLATGESLIMEELCPLQMVNYNLPSYVPLEVTAVPAPVTPDKKTYCAGKQLYIFSVPGPTPSLISYKTLNDPDLGTVTVTDQSRFAVTINRQTPITLQTYYNPVNDYMGAKLSCVAVIPTTAFASPVVAPPTPSLTVVSTFESTCAKLGAGESGSSGGFMLKTSQSDALVTLTSESGIPVLYRGYPRPPNNGVYIFSGLSTGMYLAQSVANHSNGIMCDNVQLLSIEADSKDGSADHILNIVDMSKTSTGVATMPCPQELYLGNEQSWVQYYVVAFDSDKFDTVMWNGNVVTIDIWSSSQGIKLETFMPRTAVVKYRIPHPGTYTAVITITNPKTESVCSRALPSYTINSPAFALDSFAMEVVSYPTCIDSSDGVIRITYPPTLSVATTFLSCSVGCVPGAVVDTSSAGFVFVSNLPFASSLVFRYEVMGACSFDATYVLMPSPEMHPVITQLKYMPTCDPLHAIIPMYINPITSQMTTLTYGGNKRFAWTYTYDDGTVESVGDGQQLLVSPRDVTLKRVTIGLTITYNGVCSTGDSINGSSINFFIPPLVKIDQLLFDDAKSRSLPVFCPGAADAMLVATLDPPCFDASAIDWSGTGVPSTAVLPTPVTTAAAGLEAGVYTVMYTISSPQLTCSASDQAVVPSKDGYNVLSHIKITPAKCAGDTTSIILESHPDHYDEIDIFLTAMISFEDRGYLVDKGMGNTRFHDVPDGHAIKIQVPYPNKYIFRARDTCERPLVLDPGKVAPWPLLAIAADSKVVMYVPPWHADVDVEIWKDDIIMTQFGGNNCTISIADGLKETGKVIWAVEIEPVVQILPCPYSQPTDVSVFNVLLVTGDRFLKSIMSPIYFGQTLAAINPSFSLVYPPAPAILSKRISNIYYNLSPTLTIVVGLSIPDDTVILEESVTVDGVAVPCSLVEGTGILCTVRRDAASFYMTIPYISATNGTGCSLSVMVYDLYIEALEYQPVAVYPPDSYQSCLMDTPICIPMPITFGMTRFYSSGEYDFTVPVFYYGMYVDLPMPATAVQLISPSCEGLSDGAIVWSNSMVQTDVGAGVSSINYTVTDAGGVSREVWSAVRVVPTPPISYVIQPSALPPPPFRVDAHDMIGMPNAIFAPLSITVFINGGSEETVVSIVGVPTAGRAASSTPNCTVVYYKSIFWTYSCTALLAPGYTYSFDLSCSSGSLKRRTYRLLPLPEFDVGAIIMQQPTSAYSKDGRVRATLTGGAPPFTVLVSDQQRVQKTNLRYVDIEQLDVGILKISAIDSLGSTAMVSAHLVPQAAFDIVNILVMSQSGCGAVTVSTVHLQLSSPVSIAKIGAWNEAIGDQPIVGCVDRRYIDTDYDMTTTVTSPGTWRFAVCAGGDSFVTSEWGLVIAPQIQTLTTKVTDGDICITALGAVSVGGVSATINFTGATGPVSISHKYKEKKTMAYTSPITLEPQPAGIYHYTLQDESKHCPIDVVVRFKDGEMGPCGSCDFSDTSCLGCDGKPFSKSVPDKCGVCNGHNTCLSDCIISSSAAASALEELDLCVKGGRAVTVVDRLELVDARIWGQMISINGPVTFGGDTELTSETTISLTGVTFSDAQVQLSAGAGLVTVKDSLVYATTFATAGANRRREVKIEIVFINTQVHDTQLPTVTTTVVNSTFVGISVHEMLVGNSTMNITFDYNSSMPSLNISAIDDTNTTIDKLACVLFESVPTLQTITGRNNVQFSRATFSCPGFGKDKGESTNNQKTEAAVFLGITITVMVVVMIMFLAYRQ